MSCNAYDAKCRLNDHCVNFILNCFVDLSKACDKVNHFGMYRYIKLMKRFIPTELLALLENWMAGCFAYVKWYDNCSVVFSICLGQCLF